MDLGQDRHRLKGEGRERRVYPRPLHPRRCWPHPLRRWLAGARPPDAEDAAMSDAITAELTRLRDTVETLTQGLRMMVETQGTHTEMLQAILEAATEEAGESPLPGLLAQIVERLDEQTGILH